MKAIKQEDRLGCAVACVAFILGIEYQQALRMFENGLIKVNTTGFFCRDIVNVLVKEKLNYRYSYVKPKFKRKIYKQGTIVFVRKPITYKHGHYLVRSEKLWMDSWINYPDKNIKAGFRKRLPGKPTYVIFQ